MTANPKQASPRSRNGYLTTGPASRSLDEGDGADRVAWQIEACGSATSGLEDLPRTVDRGVAHHETETRCSVAGLVDGTGFGLIGACRVASRGDSRRIGCILQSAVRTIPSDHVDPETDGGDDPGRDEGEHKRDRAALLGLNV